MRRLIYIHSNIGLTVPGIPVLGTEHGPQAGALGLLPPGGVLPARRTDSKPRERGNVSRALAWLSGSRV